MSKVTVTIRFTEPELNILIESLGYLLQARELSVEKDIDSLKDDLKKIKQWINDEKEKAKEEH